MIGLLGAFLVALSTTLLKRLSATEEPLTILLYFGLFASPLTVIPAWLVWRQMSDHEVAMFALVGGLSALGQFCSVRSYAAGELMSIAPIDYSRLVFAGTIGFLVFAEVPDRYTLVGAAIIVGSTLYIAYREAYLSRLQRAALATKPVAQRPDEVTREAAGELSTEPLRLQV